MNIPIKETFKEAKQRLIDELAKPFAEDAAKVFEKMNWTWAGRSADIYPDEKEIVNTICNMLNYQQYDNYYTVDKDVDKLGHFSCGIGRILISMFVWKHSKKWDIKLTLSP